MSFFFIKNFKIIILFILFHRDASKSSPGNQAPPPPPPQPKPTSHKAGTGRQQKKKKKGR